ncbi:ankyrin repeat and SOCS box protein 5-like isoform X3 [Salvelinus fontinalis]|nr:ankyrin repeat and SOCS box protein 5-like isoform X3 [Salvelinus fontinalis]
MTILPMLDYGDVIYRSAELIRLMIVACGMLSYSSAMAVRSCWILAGTGTRCHTRLSRAFQTCSMGDMSAQETWDQHFIYLHVNVPMLEKTTPLSEACARGHAACVTLLLQHGASPQGSSLSASPIHEAAAKGHPECIESLVHHGADVDQNTDQSGSPLYIACTNQHLSTVRKLLQLGASVNRSKDGDSPLHAAARLSNPELVTVLLEHGADCNCRDTQGKQPLDLALANSPVEKLLGHRGGVSRLMQQCRLSIRKVLGKARLSSIHGLQIPTELKQYLLYQSDL